MELFAGMNPWTYSFGWARLGLEAQSVVALRMMRLAAGGALASREAQRMIVEKGAAAVAAQMAAAAALAGGRGPGAAAARALGTYKRAVSRNRHRLTRRR
jgi:hypothetical protein